MALQKSSVTEIPSDAVRLTEKEALEYQLTLLKNWKDKSDVFALKYGVPLLAASCTASGVYMNNFFRRKYKLGGYATIATYLPTCVIPSVVSVVFHLQFVLSDVVLFKGNCPVCLEVRAASAQAFSGAILPFVLGNVGCLGIASKYSTYDLPYITQEPLKTFKVIQKASSPLVNVLIAIVVGQALLASAVTYFEGKAVYKVQKKLIEGHNLADVP